MCVSECGRTNWITDAFVRVCARVCVCLREGFCKGEIKSKVKDEREKKKRSHLHKSDWKFSSAALESRSSTRMDAFFF